MQQSDVNLKDLAKALKESIEIKNTLTTTEFKKFHPLFKESTDTTSEEYNELCVEWTSRVSAYDPITIVDPISKKTVLELPPSSNKVADITNTNNPDIVINKFNHAVRSNHPLRHDEEDALYLFKATIEVAQDEKRLEKEAKTFAKLASRAGFEGKEDDPDTLSSDVLEKLEWD